MNSEDGYKLLILMSGFPYGKYETYMETEIEYIDNSFERIALAALAVHTFPEKEGEEPPIKQLRAMPESINLITVLLKPKVFYTLDGLACLADFNFYKELQSLAREGQLTTTFLFKLAKSMILAHHESREIKRFLKTTGWVTSADDILIYSYRFAYQPYIGVLLKRAFPNAKVIARAHRYDLYEERSPNGYLPMRETLLRELECVYPVSQDGVNYLNKKYGVRNASIRLARLGTTDHGIASCDERSKVLRIVSCSNLVPVKRVSLIIAALALIDDIRIQWVHFGDGELLGQLDELAKDVLSSNVKPKFEGHVPNSEVMRRYAEDGYHLFLNTSSSEGVPVSIMEALSFGIPCVATDVGGTGEIIDDGRNGYLLASDFDFEELAERIRSIAQMHEAEYQALREGARTSWCERCSADVVYPEFMNELKSVMG